MSLVPKVSFLKYLNVSHTHDDVYDNIKIKMEISFFIFVLLSSQEQGYLFEILRFSSPGRMNAVKASKLKPTRLLQIYVHNHSIV